MSQQEDVQPPLEPSPSKNKKVSGRSSTRNSVIPQQRQQRTSSRAHVKQKCPYICADSSGRLEETKAAYTDYDPQIIHPIKSPTIPRIDPAPSIYQPMAYIFRVPANDTNMQSVNKVTRCPPFYIQLDHTIAVIWSLYSKKEMSRLLGINQLQWAWAFLNNIKNDKGRPPKDIAHCLNSISDELIEQYADLASDVQIIRRRMLRKKVNFAPQEDSSTLDEDEEGEDDLTEGEEEGEDSSKSSSSKPMTVRQEVPFSINYADMVLHAPKPSYPACGPRTSSLHKDELKDDDLNPSGIKTLLNEIRKDQMNKIFLEVQRLNNIENYFEADDISFGSDNSELHRFIVEKLKSHKKRKMQQAANK